MHRQAPSAKGGSASNAGTPARQPTGAGVPARSISLSKGGGAIRGIGEKFAANPVAGTGSMTVPVAVSPDRSGFGTQFSLYPDSGSGKEPFGIGWNLSLPLLEVEFCLLKSGRSRRSIQSTNIRR